MDVYVDMATGERVAVRHEKFNVGSEEGFETPELATLGQNYPNPFSSKTTIAFTLPRAGRARLAIYDLLGREVAVLADAVFPTGHNEKVWDASGMPSGVYVYRLVTNGRVVSGKLLLQK